MTTAENTQSLVASLCDAHFITMTEYDITIIGSGPAGATLARLLAGKYRVLLIDKSRPKCCGGLLAPDAQEMIAQLGLVLPDTVLQGPQLFSVLVHDFDNNLSRSYQRHYLNMNRDLFDQWLLSLVPANVDCTIPGRYLRCEPYAEAGRLTVHYSQNNVVMTAATRVLIGADGAFSSVRRQFVPDHVDREMYVAVQHWFEPGLATSCYGAIFDREITDYYSWTIPKGDRLIVGSAIPAKSRVRERFALLIDKLRNIGLPLENEVFREAAQIVRPCSPRALCPIVSELPVAMLGEAAGLISPSSAEGISYAMRSAVALADALMLGIDGFQRRYKRNLRSLYLNLGLKHVKRPAMYSPFLRKIILKIGLMAIDVRKE